MLNRATKDTVFRRYNTAVFFAFVVIVLIAFSVAAIRYIYDLNQHIDRSSIELNEHASQLNIKLSQSVQAITGLVEFAKYTLKFPQESMTQLLPLAQENETFYLKKPVHDVLKQRKYLRGNITGIGDISSFELPLKQEIAMAHALTPAFITAQKMIDEATWFYYVSLNHFVNIYPWIGRDSWQFSDLMLSNLHFKEIQALSHESESVVWSRPYIDSAGTGMNASLGAGVYKENKLLGAVIIDINLARLHKSLPEISQPNQGMILYNQQDQIFIFKKHDNKPLSFNSTWDELLPESLKHLNAATLNELDDSVTMNNWLIEKKSLSVNGWTLLKYQNYDQFVAPLYNQSVFIFELLFFGLLAFLLFVHTMTRRSFIKPTTEFIHHIEYCAQGDPGKIKPNVDWLHWFQIVEDIFAQNRSLLQQLQEQNEILDRRVSEKTRALQETSKKHQRDYLLLRTVMNTIPELIIFNDPNNLLIGCNKAFEQLSQHSEAEMLGKKAVHFMPKPLAKKMDVVVDEYPQASLIKAGDFIYQGYIGQLINEQAEMLGTITILRDVTKQQMIQTALEKAKDQAEYANQVKIQFLANMSHEIRTPISAMQGMMDLLANTLLNARQQHYIQNAQSASSSLLYLIDELLDLSKIESGKMLISNDVVNMASMVDKALKLNVATIYAKKLIMTIELGADVPNYIFSDEMRLVQVLTNLLNNAIKFTEKGEIQLCINVVDITNTDAKISFKVKDSGIGIALDKQAHLFEAFTQADESMTRKYGGSGLGLSICQQIIKLMNGEIVLDSNLGDGSEFSFILSFTLPQQTIIDTYISNTLPPEFQKISEDTLTICTVKQPLSASLIATITKNNWKYSSFDYLEEIVEANFHGNVVLLINEKSLSLSDVSDQNMWKNKITLIGICHPAMSDISNEMNEYIDQLNIPYLLLDTPLYRYSLDQILLSLLSPSNNTLKHQTLPNQSLSNISHNNDLFTHVQAKKTLKGVSILLVEDNLVNQLVAKELLIDLGAKVIIADNGEIAITLLEKSLFDVILMDIQMPVMDGLTAAKKIRNFEQYQTLPIIAMTAHARTEDKERSIAAGMNLHIAKPITSQILLSSILQVLESSINS